MTDSGMNLARLRDPFPANDLNWLIITTSSNESSALVAPYIDARAVMNRLDDVVGPENWQVDYTPGPAGGVLCRLSIRINGEWITKSDGAENTDIEAVKGGISDALRRAAVTWGIGRYLYDAPKLWVPCEKHGKRVELKEMPRLPARFYPDGEAQRKVAASPPPVDVDRETGEIRDEPEPPGKDWRALFEEHAAKYGITDGDIARFIKRSLSPAKKWDAIRAYCDEHRLSPSQLLDAIHSAKVLAAGQAASSRAN